MLEGRIGKLIQSRLDLYREVHPRFVSSLVMIAAAGVSAIVAIAYARLIDWATTAMIFMAEKFQLAFFLAAPIFFACAWALVHFVSPEAGGSGIPQVLANIEQVATGGKSRKVWQGLRLIAVKISSSTLAVLGGGVVGREGPTIQISAAIFEMFDSAFKRYVTSHRSHEALLIAGGGAGLAAAFNTPLGGVVFAIEELASQHFKTFKGVLILAVVTAGYVTQAVLGPYLFIGHPTIGTVTTKDAIYGLIAATVIGSVGALFGSSLYKIMIRLKSVSPLRRLALACFIGLVMSGTCLWLGSDASGGGTLMIRKLLFAKPSDATNVSWFLAIWRVVGMTVTYASGCAGGIFAPSLAAGAALGSLLANIFTFDNHNLMIVLAMIAFLTGATRSPFTCFILVFEMTDRQAAVIPMLAAALLASLAARAVESESFYEKMRNTLLQKDQTTQVSSPKPD